MGKYTIYEDQFVDDEIQKYLDIIIERVLFKINKKSIKAIVLYGGFGRGEGGVLIDGEQVRPINDFDITIFPKKDTKNFRSKYLNILSILAETLLDEVPIKQIDLGIGDLKKFNIRKLKWFYTVNAHEYIHGSKLLFGGLNLEKYQKSYKSSKIPMLEGLKYLYTRGSGLIIPLLDKYAKTNLISTQNIFIEINKVNLALGDSFLIFNKSYSVSYRKRILIGHELDFSILPNGKLIKECYSNALNWKIRPTYISDNFDIEKEISKLIKLYIPYFLWFETKRLKKTFNSLVEYISFNIAIKRTIRNKITKDDYFVKNLPTMLTLIAPITNQLVVDKDEFKKLYSACDKNEKIETSWEEITINYLKRFHYDGIVTKILDKIEG